jgi:ABC-type nickel/cobalt efflux system permease component RcnA
MTQWLLAIQRWLYGGIWTNLETSVDVSGVLALLGGAFVFRVVHALIPGHGKAVLAFYHLGRPSRLLDDVVTGTLLALPHIGLAVFFVLAGVAVIGWQFARRSAAAAIFWRRTILPRAFSKTCSVFVEDRCQMQPNAFGCATGKGAGGFTR